jgi:hypothetical protein
MKNEIVKQEVKEVSSVKVGSVICVKRNKLFNFRLLNSIISIDGEMLKTDGEHILNVNDINETFKIVTDAESLTAFQKQREKVNSGTSKIENTLKGIFNNDVNGLLVEVSPSKVSLFDYTVTLKIVTDKKIYDTEKTQTVRVSNSDKEVLNKVKQLSPEKLAKLLEMLA